MIASLLVIKTANEWLQIKKNLQFSSTRCNCQPITTTQTAKKWNLQQLLKLGIEPGKYYRGFEKYILQTVVEAVSRCAVRGFSQRRVCCMACWPILPTLMFGAFYSTKMFYLKHARACQMARVRHTLSQTYQMTFQISLHFGTNFLPDTLVRLGSPVRLVGSN